MDKRKEENLRVKNSITTALFTLMQEKSFAKITVTDIVTRAGVARASYYRNYDSKDDILTTLVSDILEDFKETADYELTNYLTYKNVERSFTYFKKYKHYLLNLYQSGFASVFLDGLNQFHEENAGNMSIHSIERYRLYIFTGALFNTAIVWMENDTKEDIASISAAFCEYFGITD
ncbi:MAG: TetR/AcrR family transcriptional regulator [Lachnospiraceae bacterium]